MSHVLGEIDGETRLDVPTMMKLLMVVYNNVRDDVVMDEVAEAVGDAICMLGDMRKVAQDVVLEADVSGADIMSDIIIPRDAMDPRKIC